MAVLLLVVNDWVLKPRFPGVVTGKLSDVAGLIFAPVVLSAAIGLVLKLARVRDPYLTQRRLVLCIAATGLTFAAVKLSAGAAEAVAHALSHIGRRASIYLDRTDLLALPALAIAYWIGRDELARLRGS
ncbi:MAG TPA: hypothetical protein VL326_03555 [Kofleriaceae bacterium]|nr:hypothetical protein [Kofleriaceae bacterium]